MLVYEPFDYGESWLNDNGGALGTVGTWVSNDTGCTDGWRVVPEGQLSGIAVNPGYDPLNPDAPGILNTFDGTVPNLPTSGGYAGPAGAQLRGGSYGDDNGSGNLDAHIALDPSVTATFTSGTTTWFSYVGAFAWDRNQGSPTFMICTDPTVNGGRGMTMENEGNGIGGTGGPTRYNLQRVYPHYFEGGIHHQTPGGYLGGVLGNHDGIITGWGNTATSDGVLGPDDRMTWQASDTDGFGAPNIVVGKIEWDADTGDYDGYDVITVVRFYQTDEITEDAFNALVEAQPTLSSRNWPDAVTPADPDNPSNRPDLDQSQFDMINISSLKFFVDEIRIGTTFDDIIGNSAVGILGDLNGDEVVDAADYIILKGNFGTTGDATPEMGDIAGADGSPGADGVVDALDLQLLAAQMAAAANAVPEPATLFVMMAAGLPALLKRRQRRS